MSLSLDHRLELSQEQKLGLKHLLLLEQKLRHPDIPNASKGLEGMQIAHEILRTREAVGILIGGLAEAVWSQRRKPEDLAKHKDVDVAVLDDTFELKEKFEGGIDWWMSKSGKITIGSDASSIEGVQKQWHENGNGVVLSFGINKGSELRPGLYIPDSEWVVDMREYEADANVDYGRISAEFDEDVFEKFREQVRRRVKTRLPKFIREAFKDYILSGDYESDGEKIDAVNLDRFDLETIRGINGFEGNDEEPDDSVTDV
ncbi:MAG: hypothetical protein O3A80_01145 [bacterium]|nr:hypothetical protein [bacterium]